MADVERKPLNEPDESRPIDKGTVEIVKIGGSTVMRTTFQPGWKWSECVKPVAGTDSCQIDHLGYCVSGQLRVRIVTPQPVEDGRLGELDRVARAGRRDAPAVEDDECYEGIRAAVSHIALNDSTWSDAPPTRAPSPSGCASSAPALSGLTEPP